MGAQRIALVLATGEVIDDVVVAWGEEIVSVAGQEPRGVPLQAVVDVIGPSAAEKAARPRPRSG